MIQPGHQLERERSVVLIAANPKAGSQSRQRHIKQLMEWLTDRGLTAEISTDLAHVESRAKSLHQAGRLRALVAAGGDGTLAEAVNRTEPRTPLAIYPCGTANLVANYIGATTQCETFGQMLIDGVTVEFDAGRANGRLFLAVCSCGFDAEVVSRLHTARAGHISKLSYLAPVAQALGSYVFSEMQVYCTEPTNGQSPPEPIAARWAFVSNLPCYGGGIQPGIGAIGTDGQLDLCTLRQGSLWHIMRYLPYMLTGTQRDLADCTMRRAASVRIESNSDVPYEVDGDPGGRLPVEIDVLPRRLRLIVPRSTAERLSAI